jgi:hypothetical protein
MPSKLCFFLKKPTNGSTRKLSELTTSFRMSSLFITTTACFKGANNPCLRPNIPPNVVRCFSIAAELFETGDAVTISPAIGKLGLILRERVLGTW